jgi:protein RecA
MTDHVCLRATWLRGDARRLNWQSSENFSLMRVRILPSILMADRERKRLVLQDDKPPADRPRARLRLNDEETVKKTPKPVAKPAPVEPKSGGRYFAREATLTFFSSGCKTIDLALGGGWVCGRVSNVVGDKSSGKTLMAIEAMANYARTFPDASKFKIRYYEVEEAFDDGYAEVLGMPLNRVERGGESADTVQEFARDLTAFCKKIPAGGGGLYIVDSLDALSDEGEINAKIDKKTGQEKGTYGMGKAKEMSRMFRRLIRKIKRANVHLMVISQIREKINVSFGEKYTRAGGKALDFYASHVVWLAEIGKVYKVRNSVKRAVGVQVKLRVKKNKVALPFREVEYPILFAYGTDDLRAALEWLDEVGRLSEVGMSSQKEIDKFMEGFHKLPAKEAGPERKRINKVLRRVWYEIEATFLPPQGKY